MTVIAGCTTTSSSNTARTGTEQLLISTAIDQALGDVQFDTFSGRAVLFDDKYVDCVDKNYLVASIRHRLMQAGARIVDSGEKADVILEARSGAVGTDSSDSFLGVPEITIPGMVSIPEVRVLTRNSQLATAKIGLVAYDAKSREVLGDGGVTLARSNDNNWYVLGIGPYRNGAVPEEIQKAAVPRRRRTHQIPLNHVSFRAPEGGTRPVTSQVRLTSGTEAKHTASD